MTAVNNNWLSLKCFSFGKVFLYYRVATVWQCMLRIIFGQSDGPVCPLKLIVVCSVIATPCVHEMKKVEIQREELIPPMFTARKEIYMATQHVRFVELSLSNPSQQITESQSLHFER